MRWERLVAHLVLGIASLAILESPSLAQPGASRGAGSDAKRSHIDLPDDKPSADLVRRLRAQEGLGNQNPFNSELLRKLLPDLSNEQAMKEWIEKLRLDDPRQLEKLNANLSEYIKQNPDDPKFKNIDPQKLAEQFKSLTEKQGTPPFVPNPNKQQFSPNPQQFQARPPKPPAPVEVAPANPETKGMANWLQRNLGNSKAVQNLVRDLGKLEKDGQSGGAGRPSWLPDWKFDRGEGFGNWATRNFSFLQNIKLPEFKFGNVKLPSLGSGGPSGGGFSGGHISAPGRGSWIGLILVVVIGAVGLAVWMVLLQKRGVGGPRKKELGTRAWPVDPALITSRHELVKAFEHLTLEKCGEEARVLNHRAIAGLMSQTTTQSRAANGLAGLYEQARYTPADQELTDQQYAEARQQIRMLVDGSAA